MVPLLDLGGQNTAHVTCCILLLGFDLDTHSSTFWRPFETMFFRLLHRGCGCLVPVVLPCYWYGYPVLAVFPLLPGAAPCAPLWDSFSGWWWPGRANWPHSDHTPYTQQVSPALLDPHHLVIARSVTRGMVDGVSICWWCWWKVWWVFLILAFCISYYTNKFHADIRITFNAAWAWLCCVTSGVR